MKLRTLTLTLIAVMTLALSASADYTTSQTFIYPSTITNPTDCTANVTSQCSESNLSSNTAPTAQFNVTGFGSIGAPVGAVLDGVTIQVSNFITLDVTATNSSGSSGSQEINGNDTSQLSYTGYAPGIYQSSGLCYTSGSFYCDKLATENTLDQVAAESSDSFTLWANDYPSSVSGSIHNSGDFIQVSAAGDAFNPATTNSFSQSTSIYSGSGDIPIYWTDSTSVTHTDDNTTEASSQYVGVEIVVTYDYSFGEGGSVPEPASLLLMGSGLSLLAGAIRRRAAKA